MRSIFHCITRFVLPTRVVIPNANSFCALQYHMKIGLLEENNYCSIIFGMLKRKSQYLHMFVCEHMRFCAKRAAKYATEAGKTAKSLMHNQPTLNKGT